MKSPGYNKTHLPLDLAEERQIIHRDYLAHCLRWSHVIKHCEIGERVLDLGSADGPMAMALYTNRYKPELYLGCDIRKAMVEKGREKMKQAPWAQFLEVDLCKDFERVRATMTGAPSIITSFEFVEHIPEVEVEPFLVNVKQLMVPETRFFLSTPCFDGKNKAANHIKEWTYEELKTLLEKHFTIEDHFGTFMSQKDLKRAFENKDVFAEQIMGPAGGGDTPSLFHMLHEYYDSNLLAILFAPLFASYARNCIWRLKI